MSTIDTTKWKQIPGFDGAYEIRCIDGFVEIRSYRKKGGGLIRTPHLLPGHTIQQGPEAGRRSFNLTYPNRKKASKQAALWLLMTFEGPLPFPRAEACHNDGDQTNDALYNLRYDSHGNNVRDREYHGTNIVGERNGQAKLTPANVHLIRTADSTKTSSELAERLGVSIDAVNMARKGISWREHPTPAQRNYGSTRSPNWQPIGQNNSV